MGNLSISEKTSVNLYLVGVAVCFAFWVGLAYSIAIQAREDNVKQDVKIEAMTEMKTDIAVIKSILENKKK